MLHRSQHVRSYWGPPLAHPGEDRAMLPTAGDVAASSPRNSGRVRAVHSRADVLAIHYLQDLSAGSRTDRFWIGKTDTEARVLLLDTNRVEPALADLLAESLASRSHEILEAEGSPHEWYREGQKTALEFVRAHDVPPERAAVNAALIAVRGRSLSLLGAFRPLYLHLDPGFLAVPFPGGLWGVEAERDTCPEPVVVLVRSGQVACVLSDGMLESRDIAGNVNGDRPFREMVDDPRAWTTPPEDAWTLMERYRAADAQRHDSHALLLIG